MAEVERGLTTLEAVNSLLRAIGHRPVESLDTDGGSDASEAEEVLDRTREIVLTRGYEGTTEEGIAFTADGSGNIDFAESIVRIECTGPGRYRGRVTMREGRAYATHEGTDDFGSGTVLHFDVTKNLAWANLTPELKHIIVAEATQVLKRRYAPDQVVDQMLGEEKTVADAAARRSESERPDIGQSPRLIARSSDPR